MRRGLLFILFIYTSNIVGQTCADHPYFQDGRILRYTYLNDKNDETGGNVLKISNVKISGNSFTSTLSYSMHDKTSAAEGSVTCSCKNGKVSFPAYGYYKKNYETVDGKDTIRFMMQFLNGTPSQELIQPKIGSKISGHEFNYKIFVNGLEMNFLQKCFDLKVVSSEMITVGSSQYTAWKITGLMETSIKDLAFSSVTPFEIYYNLEKGIIKQIFYDADGKISSSVVLK